MTALLRVAGVAAFVGLICSTAAARSAGSAVLPVDAVVRGAVITQPFGCTPLTLEPFDPYCPSHHFHTGVDLAAPAGTPVYAAMAGMAVTGYDARGCGLFVAVDVAPRVRLLYCHLRRATVTAGPVSAGDQVGELGSSGLATGPHLHLEVQVDGRPVDPVPWLAVPPS